MNWAVILSEGGREFALVANSLFKMIRAARGKGRAIKTFCNRRRHAAKLLDRVYARGIIVADITIV